VVCLWVGFDLSKAGFQYEESRGWIPSLGLDYIWASTVWAW